MSLLKFKNLVFEIDNNKIYLLSCGNIDYSKKEDKGIFGFCECQVSGENKDSHLGAKMICSSEASKFIYQSHEITDNVLTVVMSSNLVEAKITFTSYDDCNAVRVFTEYKNISDSEICLEDASSVCVTGLGDIYGSENIKFTRFFQSHHAECQPRTYTFKDLGLYQGTGAGQKKIAFANVGSWSTKEELPQGIIENENGKFTMFQIESNNSWYYEISEYRGVFYLYLGGGNSTYTSWLKKLKPSESYKTPTVALAFGDSLDEVVGEITKYRRNIIGEFKIDSELPSIFNEYMHLSWDAPEEGLTKKYAPVVKETGVKYYVIDCGWHDEVDECEVYHYVGKWVESKRRFPSGVRKTTDFIRSLGLKAGLWIEPEVVGYKNYEMIEYYGDDCFLQRNGKKVLVMNRYYLDYRKQKVRDYMSETIRRMVEDYGADYIKMDFNQDFGVGTDNESNSFGDGLEQVALAFAGWVEEMTKKFPQVIFEGCSSGGMRMDYKTLSLYPLVSTSDQVCCYKYPKIACNILSAVIPEQSAVWAYPVGGINGEMLREVKKEWADENVDEDRVALNMINSFLGRMHLAGHIELLDGNRFELVKEGVCYYEKLALIKKKALPCFPLGFTGFEKKNVCAGIFEGNNYYIAVYNLGGERKMAIPFKGEIKCAKVGYPSSSTAKISKNGNNLEVEFDKDFQAIFVEVSL